MQSYATSKRRRGKKNRYIRVQDLCSREHGRLPRATVELEGRVCVMAFNRFKHGHGRQKYLGQQWRINCWQLIRPNRREGGREEQGSVTEVPPPSSLSLSRPQNFAKQIIRDSKTRFESVTTRRTMLVINIL